MRGLAIGCLIAIGLTSGLCAIGQVGQTGRATAPVSRNLLSAKLSRPGPSPGTESPSPSGTTDRADPNSIGIALSGGGHRATAFGLGALVYFADARVNESVTTITSVSGGSLLNAYLALGREPFNRLSPEKFDADAARLAHLVAGNQRSFVWTVRALAFTAISSTLLLILGFDRRIVLLSSAGALFGVAFAFGPRSGGFLFGHWVVWVFVAAAIWMLQLIGVVVLRPRATRTWARVSAAPQLTTWAWRGSVLALLVAWGSLVQQRHAVAGVAFGEALGRVTGSPTGARATLEDMQAVGIRHVLCATELHAGQHAYFTHDLVYSRGFGLGAPGRLPVRVAVQASADFPGGFPPRAVHASRFGFSLPDVQSLKWKSDYVWGPVETDHHVPGWMVLSDGGVFDNTADSWYLDARDRSLRLSVAFDKVLRDELTEWRDKVKKAPRLDDAGIAKEYDLPQYAPSFREPFDLRHKETIRRLEAIRAVPSKIIVVNAGKPEPWQSLWSAWMPFIGELTGLIKISSTMYNNGTAATLRDLSARFEHDAPPGAVIDIAEDPFMRAMEASERELDGTGVPKEQVIRSRKTFNYFRGSLAYTQTTPELQMISDLANLNITVPTTLDPLGAETTARLMYHGYLQAMVTLHVRFGTPLMDPRPQLTDFLELAAGRVRTRRPSAFRN